MKFLGVEPKIPFLEKIIIIITGIAVVAFLVWGVVRWVVLLFSV